MCRWCRLVDVSTGRRGESNCKHSEEVRDNGYEGGCSGNGYFGAGKASQHKFNHNFWNDDNVGYRKGCGVEKMQCKHSRSLQNKAQKKIRPRSL